MYIDRYKTNGRYYLRLVREKRITDAKGNSVSRKESVLSLGNYDQSCIHKLPWGAHCNTYCLEAIQDNRQTNRNS